MTGRIAFKKFIVGLFSQEGFSLKELDYVFCDDAFLLDINQRFLQHDELTDIITFDLSEGEGVKGEIYISVDRVRENALSFGVRFGEEMRRVMIHGALHLCGYKDKTSAERKVMRAKEDEYLHQLRLTSF